MLMAVLSLISPISFFDILLMHYQSVVSGQGLKDLGLAVSGPSAEVRRGGTIWSSWGIERDFPYRVGRVSLPADK